MDVFEHHLDPSDRHTKISHRTIGTSIGSEPFHLWCLWHPASTGLKIRTLFRNERCFGKCIRVWSYKISQYSATQHIQMCKNSSDVSVALENLLNKYLGKDTPPRLRGGTFQARLKNPNRKANLSERKARTEQRTRDCRM